MKKGLLKFSFVLFLVFCMTPIVFAKEIFYSNESMISEDQAVIFDSIDNGDVILNFYSDYIVDSTTSVGKYYLYVNVISKETGLSNNILLTEKDGNSYFEEITALKINDEQAIVAYGSGTLKLNLKDYSVIKNSSDLDAYKIKKINDNYLLYYYDDLYIVDDDLNVLYSSSDYSVYDATVEDSNIYVLDSNSTKDEDNIYHYEYVIYTLDEKLELIEEKKYKYSDDTQNMWSGYVSVGEFLKNEDEFYYVSHVIRKFNTNGIIEDVLGDVSPQENGKDYSTMKKVGQYYVTGGYVIEDGVTHAFVEVFDKELNSLQYFNINELENKIIQDGLSVVKMIVVTDKGFYANGAFRDGPNDIEEGFSIEFLLYYNIATKTDGNGKVEVIDSSKANEEIEFVVTPNEGYQLKEVKVTDALGNVVIFNENTFTMPSADVLIEATFVVENPDTLAINVILVLLLALSALMISLKSLKKRTELS